MADTHRIALVGVGATGAAIGQSLRRRSDCTLVGAVDIDPARLGRDLGELLGGDPLGVTVGADAASLPGTDVAVVATSSHLETLEPTVVPLLRAGINVVSICEELGHPHQTHPAVTDRLDRVARENGVTILGTGCNPGLIMDTLPLLLSGLTQSVRSVEIRRTADMSRYGALVAKFGLGLTTEEFAGAQAAGSVTGHIGFEQAIGAVAAGLGWELDEIVVDPVRPAFIAPEAREGAHARIGPGTVTAVLHAARGSIGGTPVIDVAIHFGFFAEGDPVERGDTCRLTGEEQVLEVVAERGYESFLSTVAMAANVATAVVDAEPGLRTMAELPVSAIASKGSRRPGPGVVPG